MIPESPGSHFRYQKHDFLSRKTELRYCNIQKMWYNKKVEKWFSNNFSGGGCLFTQKQYFPEHFVHFSTSPEKRTDQKRWTAWVN